MRAQSNAPPASGLAATSVRRTALVGQQPLQPRDQRAVVAGGDEQLRRRRPPPASRPWSSPREHRPASPRAAGARTLRSERGTARPSPRQQRHDRRRSPSRGDGCGRRAVRSPGSRSAPRRPSRPDRRSRVAPDRRDPRTRGRRRPGPDPAGPCGARPCPARRCTGRHRPAPPAAHAGRRAVRRERGHTVRHGDDPGGGMRVLGPDLVRHPLAHRVDPGAAPNRPGHQRRVGAGVARSSSGNRHGVRSWTVTTSGPPAGSAGRRSSGRGPRRTGPTNHSIGGRSARVQQNRRGGPPSGALRPGCPRARDRPAGPVPARSPRTRSRPDRSAGRGRSGSPGSPRRRRSSRRAAT